MRVFFVSRRMMVVVSLIGVVGALLGAAGVLKSSETVVAWVQAGDMAANSVDTYAESVFSSSDMGFAVVDSPEITAEYALLMDAETGQVLWQQNGYAEVPPASTTKILTALLALDIAPLELEVVVSAEAAAVGESSVNLQAGEVFALGELLDAALLKSANDACYAIAEGAAGSEPFFVRLMNLKADVQGAGAAHLLNTNGLPQDGHTMSAYDLALLTRLALQNPEFAERVAAKSGLMEGGSYNRSLKNTNKLLSMNEYVIGVKTGTTNAAGACLVSAMERDGRRVIAVVLHSADRYGDSLRLLNFGVDRFVTVVAVRQGARLGSVGGVGAVAENDLRLCLPKNAVENAKNDSAGELSWEYCWRDVQPWEEICSGDLLGTLYVRYGGRVIGAVNLPADGEYHPGWRDKIGKYKKGFSR